MDIVQDWAAHLVGGEEHAAITTYALRAFQIVSTIKSYLLPLVDQVFRKPDLATVALLLIIVLVSLKILNMLVQTVLFWFRLAKTVLFWGGMIALAFWMWQRGPDGMVQDFGHWRGVWGDEYEYWKEREKIARGQGFGNGFGRQPAGRGGFVW